MSDVTNKMQRTIDDFIKKLNSLRTNRANPDMISNILVDYYGSHTPLQHLAAITVPEPATFFLSIFDSSATKAIEKAIMTSPLRLNPQVDGNTIRIRLPDLTEERRLELVKVLKTTAEESKVAIRNIRKDLMQDLKDQEKNKEISEDESKREQTRIQENTDTFITKIDSLSKSKETEIMTI
jgi:ribosome recycling factor